ncbi:MAG: PepSY-associated TM helix domain-containing protein [Prevotella sp.]
MKRVFREIHLWLSVPTGIIIALICFSGAMLVFEKEITEALNPDLYFVEKSKAEPLPLDELMEKVEATLPDSVSITGVTVYPDADRAYQVSLSKPRRASLYVNQYTGEVTGRNARLPFFDTMFRLHRWLLGSSGGEGIAWGKLLTGISTLCLAIIVLTGILMWLTNRKKPLAKSLAIHVTQGWPRFWHDLHVAGGIYATIFLLAMALTGLTWSFNWYRDGFYSLFGVEGQNRGERLEVRGEGNHQRGESHERGVRSEERGGRNAHEGGYNGHAHEGGYHGHAGEGRYHGGHGSHRHSPYSRWQDVLERLQHNNSGYRLITVKNEEAAVVPAGRTSLRATDNYEFSRRSGEFTSFKSYETQDKSSKVRSAVYMVHTGSWAGIVTRILNFLAALIGFTLPLTGYYLWIRRLTRKKNS